RVGLRCYINDWRRSAAGLGRQRRKTMQAQLAAAEASWRRRKIVHAGYDADFVGPFVCVDMSAEMITVAIGGDLEFLRFDLRLVQVQLCKHLRERRAHE